MKLLLSFIVLSTFYSCSQFSNKAPLSNPLSESISQKTVSGSKARLPSSTDACLNASTESDSDNIAQMKICPGDNVSVGNSLAKVIALNPHDRKVTVKFNDSTRIDAFDVNELTVNKGCLLIYCVDDDASILQYSDVYGRIFGVNPISKRVSIIYRHSKAKDQIIVVDLKTVSIGKGCLHGYCVGDQVAYGDIFGKIVGVNPILGKIAIRDRDQTENIRIFQADLKDIAIGKGCLKGYCVGDQAAYSDIFGKIVGINPVLGKVAISWSNSKGTDEISYVKLEDVAISSLCQEYSQNNNKRYVDSSKEFENNFERIELTNDEINNLKKESPKNESKSIGVASCSIDTGKSVNGNRSKFISRIFEGSGIDNRAAVTNAKRACLKDELFRHSSEACSGAGGINCTDPRPFNCSIDTGKSEKGDRSYFKSKIFEGRGVDKQAAITNAKKACLKDEVFEHSSEACSGAAMINCSPIN